MPTPRALVVRLTRDRLTRDRLHLDPLVPLLCAVATCLYLLHGFEGYLSRDLGDYAYGGEQVARGVPPYVAVVNRAGPLAHLIPGVGALVARTVGADQVVGMRVFLMLFAVAGIAACYLLGRDVFRSRLAGVASAGVLLGCQGFIAYASDGPREKTSMLLFLLCALLAVVHRRWATAGFFIALATLTWQPVFFVAVAGAVTAILVGLPTGRGRALLKVALGGLLPTAVTVGAYATVGALGIFLDDFVLINAEYTRQSSIVTSPGHVVEIMVEGYGPSLGLFVLGLVAMVVLAVRAARRRGDRRDPRRVDLLAMGAVLLVGLAWSLVAFNGFPDAFIMLPPAAVGAGGAAVALADRVSFRAAAVATTAWALVAAGIGGAYALGTRSDRLEDQERSVDAVLDVLPPDARILSVEAPQPLVLAHQRNPSRLQLFGNGLVDYVDATWPGGSRGYGRWVGKRRPTLIALGNDGVVPGWLRPTLDGDYHPVGTTIGWDWYVSDAVDRRTRHHLREVVRRTYAPVDG